MRTEKMTKHVITVSDVRAFMRAQGVELPDDFDARPSGGDLRTFKRDRDEEAPVITILLHDGVLYEDR